MKRDGSESASAPARCARREIELLEPGILFHYRRVARCREPAGPTATAAAEFPTRSIAGLDPIGGMSLTLHIFASFIPRWRTGNARLALFSVIRGGIIHVALRIREYADTRAGGRKQRYKIFTSPRLPRCRPPWNWGAK